MHNIIIKHGSPNHQREFIDIINNKLAYEYKGKVRKGLVRPILWAVNQYDIRIPEKDAEGNSIISEFLRDIEAITFSQRLPKGANSQKHGFNIMRTGILILRKILKFQTPEKKEGPTNILYTRPHNTFFIGSKPDPIQTTSLRNKREVL